MPAAFPVWQREQIAEYFPAPNDEMFAPKSLTERRGPNVSCAAAPNVFVIHLNDTQIRNNTNSLWRHSKVDGNDGASQRIHCENMDRLLWSHLLHLAHAHSDYYNVLLLLLGGCQLFYLFWGSMAIGFDSTPILCRYPDRPNTEIYWTMNRSGERTNIEV